MQYQYVMISIQRMIFAFLLLNPLPPIIRPHLQIKLVVNIHTPQTHSNIKTTTNYLHLQKYNTYKSNTQYQENSIFKRVSNMQQAAKSTNSIADYFVNKPTSQSKKTHSIIQPTENICIKCKERYPLCCTKIYGLCLGCRSRYHDPVNILHSPLTQVFFNVRQTVKMAQTLIFVFKLPQEVHEGYGVEVRCFKPWKQMIQFPMLGTIYINDKLVTTLKPLIRCSNLTFRKDNSFFLDRQYLKETNVLRIEISQCKPQYFQRFQSDSKDQFYFLGIYLIKCQTYPQLIEHLTLKSSIDAKQSIGRFFSSPDFESQHSEITIKLQCPYALTLIKVPARGGYCKHFQTFCLQTLYKLYSQKRKWGCPICSLHLHQIVIDKWVLAAIKSKKPQTKGFSVRFLLDGTWQWKQEAVSSDDSDESDKAQLDQIIKIQKTVMTAKKTVKSPQNNEIIIMQQDNLQKQRQKEKQHKIRQKQREKQKQKQKQKFKKKQKVFSNNNKAIVIEQDQAPVSICLSKQQKLKQKQKQKQFKLQKVQKIQRPPQMRQQQEQIIIPMIDFQSNKDKSARMLNQLCGEFDRVEIDAASRRKNHKQKTDEFKRLFKLS